MPKSTTSLPSDLGRERGRGEGGGDIGTGVWVRGTTAQKERELKKDPQVRIEGEGGAISAAAGEPGARERLAVRW